MSVYKKLQDCRIELQSMTLKKSGLNKFAGFQYFELGDFLPEVQNLFAKHGLSSTVNFTANDATLMIVDTDCNEQGESGNNSFTMFSCPVVIPTMKGCNEVQALGAMITYIRRYLYVNALEIVEHDALDATTGSDNKGKGVHKPTDTGFVPDPEELKYLSGVVDMILLKENDYQSISQYLDGEKLDVDEKVWVWDKLDSKTRSGIKKFNAENKVTV